VREAKDIDIGTSAMIASSVGESIDLLTQNKKELVTSFQLSRLPTTESGVIRIHPNAKIQEAATIMIERDFSQLPVMTNERDLKGIVSWKSIARK
jgi:CBS domain-containing protein